jgi:hypothetical protein
VRTYRTYRMKVDGLMPPRRAMTANGRVRHTMRGFQGEPCDTRWSAIGEWPQKNEKCARGIAVRAGGSLETGATRQPRKYRADASFFAPFVSSCGNLLLSGRNGMAAAGTTRSEGCALCGTPKPNARPQSLLPVRLHFTILSSTVRSANWRCGWQPGFPGTESLC